ncbi:uridine kinase [Lapidilactobacillus concavus DSM 17758]|uniref:Uridine kinase n=1 Tax=Lapidilactobacillus concavus DSM 17758 TaxID=1423735 RepID=A0A0R1W7Y7_9LACO|nr:uridine kinase [Lapidilactobacillus concavus]KRM13850.1 uridine kinase [Lapidilactobacillus concavus DSM 17758]GEL12736.1 uridine kinase [Lapidilactobacillus concavus]
MRKPIIIGVTGGSGSGKTTVSQKIYESVADHSVAMIQEDAYYKYSELPIEQRRQINFDHPLAFDTDLLLHQLQQLVNREAVDLPIYDYSLRNPSSEKRHQEPKDVIILEGILILDDQRLRDLMDIKVYVDTDDDIRLLRRVQRDIHERGRSLDSVFTQYLKTVKPMYHQFIEPTKRYADVIIPEGGQNSVAVDLLVTKVRSILKMAKENI